MQGGTAEVKRLRQVKLMARLLKQSEAKRLGLPGRTSLEPVSGEIGSRVTFRIAEIAVPQPGDKPRGPHLHDGFEECIYVLEGTGVTIAESGEIPIAPGDIVLIPPSEKHMTRNTGNEPLVLLCFFPAPDVGAATTEFAKLLGEIRWQQRSLPAAGGRLRACRCAAAGIALGRLSRRQTIRIAAAADADGARTGDSRGRRRSYRPSLFEGSALQAGAGDGRRARPARPAGADAARHSGRERRRRQQRAVAEYAVTAATLLLRRLAWADAEIRTGNYAAFRARMLADNLRRPRRSDGRHCRASA